MQKLVLASNNQGKLKEFSLALAPFDFELIAQGDLNIQTCEEPACTFVENAIIKARHASQQSGLPALADDSGLMVDDLNGEPGIYSARYSGENANDQTNIEKLLAQLNGVPDEKRSAQFTCVLAFLKSPDDPSPIIAQGFWLGRILTKPTGNDGFGYDPIFGLDGQGGSAAQLTREQKNQLSHRGQAVRQLLAQLKSYTN